MKRLLILPFLCGLASPAAAQTGRVTIAANVSQLSATRSFSDSDSFPLNAETASYSVSYKTKPAAGAEVGGWVRLWKMVGVGGRWTQYSSRTPATVSGSLPHPFFFNRPRSISGETPELTHEEQVFHLSAVLQVEAGSLQVAVSAGPSWFTVRQPLVTSVSFTDEFPYDSATFTRAATGVTEVKKPGAHVGADVAYYLTRNIGVGGSLQLAQVSIGLPIATRTIDVDAGGATFGAGLRLRF